MIIDEVSCTLHCSANAGQHSAFSFPWHSNGAALGNTYHGGVVVWATITSIQLSRLLMFTKASLAVPHTGT